MDFKNHVNPLVFGRVRRIAKELTLLLQLLTNSVDAIEDAAFGIPVFGCLFVHGTISCGVKMRGGCNPYVKHKSLTAVIVRNLTICFKFQLAKMFISQTEALATS